MMEDTLSISSRNIHYGGVGMKWIMSLFKSDSSAPVPTALNFGVDHISMSNQLTGKVRTSCPGVRLLILSQRRVSFLPVP